MSGEPASGGVPAGTRGYRYRDDVAIADAAFEAWGASLEELFAAAADATANAMIENLDAIEPRQRRPVRIEDNSVDLLLYRALEELIFLKDAEGLLLRLCAVRIQPRDGGLLLEGEACGEPPDPERHRLLADVKAVTLHRLRVEQTADGWRAFVVLDI